MLSIVPESGGCDGVRRRGRRRLLALGVVTPLLECVHWNTNIHVFVRQDSFTLNILKEIFSSVTGSY